MILIRNVDLVIYVKKQMLMRHNQIFLTLKYQYYNLPQRSNGCLAIYQK